MITVQLVEQIAERVRREGLSESLVAGLRRDHPGLHFTYCMDDDVHGATPFLERPGFNIYLVGGRDHCPSLSCGVETASGMVLAEVIEDD